MISNKTLDVMINTAVKKENGRIVFSQCRPKLYYQPAKVLQMPTTVDIEQRLRHNLSLIRITRGQS